MSSFLLYLQRHAKASQVNTPLQPRPLNRIKYEFYLRQIAEMPLFITHQEE